MISLKDLEHLATLSRIKLVDSEKESLLKEFDSVLGYIDQLKEVNVSLDSAGRIGAVKNVTRPDEVVTVSAEDRERLLKAAPKRDGDSISVKKILGE